MFKQLWKEVPGPVKLAWLFAWGLGLALTVIVLWAIVKVVLWLT